MDGGDSPSHLLGCQGEILEAIREVRGHGSGEGERPGEDGGWAPACHKVMQCKVMQCTSSYHNLYRRIPSSAMRTKTIDTSASR